MALNFHTSTLSLTLPISCQICLGKVRQPVICTNHHVFCSTCMEMWLKHNGQCPTCRVPITEENPCRKIIGGTNEEDHSERPSMRRRLRKTRGELLLQEYEEEIERLLKENESLETKNQDLEAQLKTALHSCTTNVEPQDDKIVPLLVMEELKNKLRAATDGCDKIKQDMEKLKEANRTLRSQNVDLAQENARLKTEVVNRSPLKFGRYTVAALEVKIQQYEREVNHLKKALERSDQYIDDLEIQIRRSEQRRIQETSGNFKTPAEALTQQQKISMMMRSLSDTERWSICSNPEAESLTFPRNHSLVFMPSTDEADQSLAEEKKIENSESRSDVLPTTPSTAFRSLTLRSPGIRGKRVAFKPAPYLRRLDFEGHPTPETFSMAMENKFEKPPKNLDPNDTNSIKSHFWDCRERSKQDDPACPGPSRISTSTSHVDNMPGGYHLSSEASMDAAYLDKISELDTMMLDAESSSSQGSQPYYGFSPPTDCPQAPETCPNVPLSSGKVKDGQQNQRLCDGIGDAGNAPDVSVQLRKDEAHGSLEPGQTEELSFDLLFDPLDDIKASTSSSFSPTGHDQDDVTPSVSSPSCSSTQPVDTQERQTLTSGHPTKRKFHSSFNTYSPTKLSKLM